MRGRIVPSRRELEAKIRALEAELRNARIDAAKERSLSEVYIRQKHALEAELAYLRRNTDHGILRAFDELKARAEKAEAEVKRLKAKAGL